MTLGDLKRRAGMSGPFPRISVRTLLVSFDRERSNSAYVIHVERGVFQGTSHTPQPKARGLEATKFWISAYAHTLWPRITKFGTITHGNGCFYRISTCPYSMGGLSFQKYLSDPTYPRTVSRKATKFGVVPCPRRDMFHGRTCLCSVRDESSAVLFLGLQHSPTWNHLLQPNVQGDQARWG